MSDLHEHGFKKVTRVEAARERLRGAVTAHSRTDTLDLSVAEGRALAEPVDARHAVPDYHRAAMDGFAVRAGDTVGASDRAPEILREVGTDGEPAEASVGPGEATRVHTGSALPDGADAVVMVEHTDRFAGEVEVFDAVAEGENVAPPGEDVEQGQRLYDAGHQLRPSDMGLLKSCGVRRVRAYERPTVGVIPTGEEVVERDPGPGEVVETNGLTISRYVERWGGAAKYRNVVTDDEEALRAAVERDLTKDLIVTTGGSSVGERDLIPGVVDRLGEVLVHGVALKPGHPFGFGVVRDTPVLMLPGYPVACIVNAVQFLRPAIKWAGNLPLHDHPTREATLTRKVPSEPGTRTFARVTVERGEDGLEATPTRASGSGVLSSVALADGWVVVPERTEGYAEGDAVSVEDWEYYA
ncbi:molybdopterin molybdenumtransferase MoeA [Haloglomus irregulare]|jgi:molybdopterin molybdotransferase|uniref:Molybdopterin molybdenumtransferase MoeA n=1 Tax=Haloglomus irregulare TaxID=2234134 RepID=A0A554NCX0_9EURY|nr:gephyrin-like molybdotransferase Glp [Haloglomus irregulare]TSD15236.1 molybdopterin molybdenumtransferase MoeA [Haloglomus irregulare]